MQFFRAASQAWRSPSAVTAMAIAAALVVLAACGALLYYADQAVDRTMEARETQLMGHAMNHRLYEMLEDVSPSSVWTEAYEKAISGDRKYLHSSYGDNFQRFRRHSVTVVFDGADRPVYAGADDRQVDPAVLAPIIAQMRPVLRVMRADEARREARDPTLLGLERRTGVSTSLRVGRKVYLVGASTIVPEADYGRAMPPGPGPLVVSAMEIDARLLKELERDSGLEAARVLLDAPYKAGATPVRDVQGRVIAAITSTPPRLVHSVFYEARAEIIRLGALVVSIVAGLIWSLRRLARGVAEARDRAEAGDHAKSEFIANISHEIRTPLNGVLGMAQVMDTHELSAEQRGRMRVIRESGATLLALLNDVLDLSKIEAGKLEIVETRFNLQDLTQRVTATFEGVAAAKDLPLIAEVDPAARGVWIGDALRIRQVLSNLISNAVKFTAAGQVRVAVSATDEGLTFEIEDTGIGLDEAEAAGLFEKFKQADSTTTRRYGGTGLGLSIVRALVELMGGEISVRGRRGEGSCFQVRLPLARAVGRMGAEAVVAPAAPSRALRVLAAEDNAINQLVLRALVEPLDVDLTVTANGREAVAAFSKQAFDVILMDVQMPEMNGLDATAEIRAIEAARGGRRTPILALSANVMTHQVESYLAAGMDGCVAKPLDLAALFAALDEVLAEAGEAEAEAAVAA